MSDSPKTPPGSAHAAGLSRWLNMNSLGALLLTAVVIASAWQVIFTQRAMATETKKVIKIAHWQLEAGYRQAMDKIIAKYEQMHPDVKIEQVAITEKLYSQCLNTELISGEGPDLTEMGASKMTSQASLLVRYYLPLGELVNEPNPYNKGTPLEKRRWRETLIDGMRGGFNDSLQEYYQIPTAFAMIRLYYNKDLLRQVTDHQDGPRSFADFLAISNKLKQIKGDDNRPIIPVVGCYGTGNMIDPLAVAFTANEEANVDTELVGSVSTMQTYEAFCRGKINFDSPRIKAMYACYRQLVKQFANDFSSMDRQTAVFKFVQGHAAMLATGSWDATSLTTQVKFPLGVCQLPVPTQDDPLYGPYIAGRPNEAGNTGGVPYGVNKASHHLKEALDFLAYLTSLPGNQEFNRMADWPPVVIGAQPSELMKPFMPDPTGYTSHVDFAYGGNVLTVYNGLLVQYLQGDIDYDTLKDGTENALRDANQGGDHAWAREYSDKIKEVRADERTLAMHATRILMDPTAKNADDKYRRLLIQQAAKNDGEEYRYRFEQFRGKTIAPE